MNETDQKFLKNWGEERTKGKAQFIGITILLFFVVLNIFNLIMNYLYKESLRFEDLLEVRKVPIYLTFSIIYGFYKWRRNERRYKALGGVE